VRTQPSVEREPICGRSQTIIDECIQTMMESLVYLRIKKSTTQSNTP
jgi:hypothetical protein